MSTPHGLDAAIRLNRGYGWAPIPLCPYAKTPAIRGLFDNPPTTETAIREVWSRAQYRIDNDPTRPQWHGLAPGLGALLGASGLLQVDADTPDEVAAWQGLCTANGYDPGPPTVLTPGARGMDGVMKHRDGGHWYFRQGDIAIDGVLKIGLGSGPDGGHAVLYGGRRITVLPPTVRDTGPYLPGGGDLRELPDFLAQLIAESNRVPVPAAADRVFGVSGQYRACAQERAWAGAVDWLDLLPDGWVLTGEERDGHRVYARPGASSDRSAVAHVDGCRHFPDATAPAPLTILTSNPGDYLDEVVRDKCPASVSKLRMYALKHYRGDLTQTRKALGLSTHPRGKAIAEQTTVPPTSSAESPVTEPVMQKPTEGEAVIEMPPSWQPADLGNRIAQLLLSCAHPVTPEVAAFIITAESRQGDWYQRRQVLQARHLPTEWIAEQIGVDAGRAHAIVRALAPALYRQYGLIVRERLLDVDPLQYGVRTQPAGRTAWALWHPTVAIEQQAAS